jgi:hypothetical protein
VDVRRVDMCGDVMGSPQISIDALNELRSALTNHSPHGSDRGSFESSKEEDTRDDRAVNTIPNARLPRPACECPSALERGGARGFLQSPDPVSAADCSDPSADFSDPVSAGLSGHRRRPGCCASQSSLRRSISPGSRTLTGVTSTGAAYISIGHTPSGDASTKSGTSRSIGSQTGALLGATYQPLPSGWRSQRRSGYRCR